MGRRRGSASTTFGGRRRRRRRSGLGLGLGLPRFLDFGDVLSRHLGVGCGSCRRLCLCLLGHFFCCVFCVRCARVLFFCARSVLGFSFVFFCWAGAGAGGRGGGSGLEGRLGGGTFFSSHTRERTFFFLLNVSSFSWVAPCQWGPFCVSGLGRRFGACGRVSFSRPLRSCGARAKWLRIRSTNNCK